MGQQAHHVMVGVPYADRAAEIAPSGVEWEQQHPRLRAQ